MQLSNILDMVILNKYASNQVEAKALFCEFEESIKMMATSFSTDDEIFSMFTKWYSSHKDTILEVEINKQDFIIQHGTSKGYSTKALYQGKWYKVSAGAFNAQAEVLSSRLAALTNLPSFVDYRLCKINGEWGTASEDFINGCRTETIKGLYAKKTGTPIEDIMKELSGRDLFRYIYKFVGSNLHYDMLEDLNLLLRFDALILNEDRHFRNLQFFETPQKKWQFVKPFDFDCSFYSCVEDLDNIDNYRRIAQPFFNTHEEQIEFMSTLSGKKLTWNAFDPEELIFGLWSGSYDIGRKEVLSYLDTIKDGGSL